MICTLRVKNPEQVSTMLKTISETIQAITVISHDMYIAC